MPVMLVLCSSKLAYYTGIILDALVHLYLVWGVQLPTGTEHSICLALKSHVNDVMQIQIKLSGCCNL